MANSKKRVSRKSRKSTKRNTKKRSSKRKASVKTVVVGSAKYRISSSRRAPSLSATSVSPYTTKKSNNDGEMYCAIPTHRKGSGTVQKWVKCSQSTRAKHSDCDC